MGRELDILERFFWLAGRSISTNFAAHAQVIGSLEDQWILAALDAVQARHPLLRMGIERSGWTGAKFVEVTNRPIPFQTVKKDDWLPIAELELERRFADDEAPLIRCVRVAHDDKNSTLILTLHHVIGDGMSATLILRDLFATIRQAADGKEPRLQALPLLPEAYQGYPWYTKFPFGLPIFLIMSLRAITCTPLSLILNGSSCIRYARFTGRTPALVNRTLDAELVTAIEARAKQERTTMHGALMAALMKAIARQRNLPIPLRIGLNTAVNLRAQLNPPVGEDTGLFSTIVPTSNTVWKNINLWTLARRARRSLTWALARKEGFSLPLFFQSGAWLLVLFGSTKLGAALYTRFMYWSTASGIPFSNIGRVQIDTNKDIFSIQNLGFYATAAVGTHFAAFAATVENRMTLNFNFQEPVYNRETVEQIADLMIEELSN